MKVRQIALLFISILACPVLMWAQTAATPDGAITVANCGTPPAGYPPAGNRAAITVDTNGVTCSSATLTGGTINVGLDTSGLATSAGQTTGNTSLGNIDTNAGATTDVAVTPGATGTVSAKLRYITNAVSYLQTGVPVTGSGPKPVTGALAVLGCGTAGCNTFTDETGGVIAQDVHIRGGTVSASFDTSGLATSAAQTDASQKTQIVGSSNAITSSDDGAGLRGLDVHISGGTVTASLTSSGLATSANQDTTNARLGPTTDVACLTDAGDCSLNSTLKRLVTLVDTPTGQQTKANSNSVTLASDTGTIPVGLADAADVAEGATTDSACGTDTGTCSQIALTKRLLTLVDTPTGQQTMANSNAVAIASNQSAIPITSSDPHCNDGAGVTTPISIQSSGASVVIPAANLKKTYICAILLTTGDMAGETVSVVAGTGTAMASGMTALVGSTTSGDGVFLAASGGGFVMGSGGAPVVYAPTAGYDVGLLINGGARVSGTVTWMQQGIGTREWWLLSILMLAWLKRRFKSTLSY